METATPIILIIAFICICICIYVCADTKKNPPKQESDKTDNDRILEKLDTVQSSRTLTNVLLFLIFLCLVIIAYMGYYYYNNTKELDQLLNNALQSLH